MRPVALRHMVRDHGVTVIGRATRMRGHAFAVMEDLDSPRIEPRLKHLTHQLIGNAVVMPVDLDVVIDIGADLLPLH